MEVWKQVSREIITKSTEERVVSSSFSQHLLKIYHF
jgi:hypothetical protein